LQVLLDVVLAELLLLGVEPLEQAATASASTAPAAAKLVSLLNVLTGEPLSGGGYC
jgi:hypothetical protein